MIGRAIALVADDQLSQAIGRYGQNVRLASKLCGWDIEIMTADELEKQIDRAMKAFLEIEGMTEELAQRLVEQGYLSYDDLSVIEPDALMELGGLTEEQVDAIVLQADDKAAENEVAENERKKFEKAEKERLATEAIFEAERAEQNKNKSDEEPTPPLPAESEQSCTPPNRRSPRRTR